MHKCTFYIVHFESGLDYISHLPLCFANLGQCTPLFSSLTSFGTEKHVFYEWCCNIQAIRHCSGVSWPSPVHFFFKMDIFIQFTVNHIRVYRHNLQKTKKISGANISPSFCDCKKNFASVERGKKMEKLSELKICWTPF